MEDNKERSMNIYKYIQKQYVKEESKLKRRAHPGPDGSNIAGALD